MGEWNVFKPYLVKIFTQIYEFSTECEITAEEFKKNNLKVAVDIFKIIFITYDCKLKNSCRTKIRKMLTIGCTMKDFRDALIHSLEKALKNFCAAWISKFDIFDDEQFIRSSFIYLNDIIFSAMVINESFSPLQHYLNITVFEWILQKVYFFLISKLIKRISKIFSGHLCLCGDCFRLKQGISFLVLIFNKNVFYQSFKTSITFLRFTTPSFLQNLEYYGELITCSRCMWVHTPIELKIEARENNPLHFILLNINKNVVKVQNRKSRRNIQNVKSPNKFISIKQQLSCNNFYCNDKPRFLCASCNMVKYCSKRCSTINWVNHKQYCLNMKKVFSLLEEVD